MSRRTDQSQFPEVPIISYLVLFKLVNQLSCHGTDFMILKKVHGHSNLLHPFKSSMYIVVNNKILTPYCV